MASERPPRRDYPIQLAENPKPCGAGSDIYNPSRGHHHPTRMKAVKKKEHRKAKKKKTNIKQKIWKNAKIRKSENRSNYYLIMEIVFEKYAWENIYRKSVFEHVCRKKYSSKTMF